MPTPPILTLEPLRPDHARELFPGLSDPAGYRFLPDEPPASLRALQDRYTRQARGRSPDGSQLWLNWVVRQCRDGEAVGYTQATISSGVALIGYHIVPSRWRRGFGVLSVQLMLEILFGRADVLVVEALVDTRNQPSIALLRRLGFTPDRTIVDADHFKGASSDEHVFVLPLPCWQSHHAGAVAASTPPRT